MKSKLVCLVVTGVCLAAGVWAQGALSLKRGGERRGISWEQPKSRQAQRGHYLVELAQPPTPEMLKALEGRGQRVVSYVPMNGFILSAEGEGRLGGLEVVSVSPLRASATPRRIAG